MGTIGTESAFEVSARARALEAEGRPIDLSPDRRARFRHAGQRPRRGQARARRGRDALRAVRRASRRCARRSPRTSTKRKGVDGRPVAGLRDRRRQGRDALRDPRARRPGRRGHRPRPRLPDLRVADPVRRRDAGADPDPDGERLPARRRRAGVAHHAADAGAVHQLAGQPDRRRADPRRPRRASPSSPSSTTCGSSPTRSTAGSCTTARSTSRSRHSPGWRNGRSSSTASPRPSR